MKKYTNGDEGWVNFTKEPPKNSDSLHCTVGDFQEHGLLKFTPIGLGFFDMYTLEGAGVADTSYFFVVSGCITIKFSTGIAHQKSISDEIPKPPLTSQIMTSSCSLKSTQLQKAVTL